MTSSTKIFTCNFCKGEDILDSEDELDDYYFECSGCSNEGLKDSRCCNGCDYSRDFYDGPPLCPMHLDIKDVSCHCKDLYMKTLLEKCKYLVHTIRDQKSFELYGEDYQISRVGCNIKSV